VGRQSSFVHFAEKTVQTELHTKSNSVDELSNKLNFLVLFYFSDWAAFEGEGATPKFAVQLTHPDWKGGKKSVTVGAETQIVQDTVCTGGVTRFGSRSDGNKNRIPRYGMGAANISVQIGSWAPAMPGYDLTVFLLTNNFLNTPSPIPQDHLELDIVHPENFIYYYIDSLPLPRMVAKLKEDSAPEITVTVEWKAIWTESVDIVASTTNSGKNAVRSISSKTISNDGTGKMTAAFTVQVKSTTGAGTYHMQLDLVDTDSQELLASSNVLTFTIVDAFGSANGILTGAGVAPGSSTPITNDESTKAVWFIPVVAACIILLSLLLVAAVIFSRRASQLHRNVKINTTVSLSTDATDNYEEHQQYQLEEVASPVQQVVTAFKQHQTLFSPY